MLEKKRRVWSWALYDWANSAFATTVMAGFFPLFFKSYWADPGDPDRSTFYLGLANSAASIAVACFAPFLGAVADRGSAKKKFLMLFAFLGVVMTGGLWLLEKGNWPMAVLFYITATIGFSGGNVFYDSLLPAVAPEQEVDRVSALGFALGYIGGGVLFLVNVLMYLKPEMFGIADGARAIKICFLTVGVWWALFSIPIFLFVPEPRLEASVPFSRALILGWRQLLGTVREVRKLKVVGLFLLAYWFYIDGVDTVIRMAVDYGMSLGFPSGALITALLMVQFIAFPATLVYGRVAEKIGVKRAVLAGIAGYGVITCLACFMSSEWHFYALAATVGLFQGGIQALSRSLYCRLIPERSAAEFYGFYNMLGKFAAVLGPAMIGGVTLVTGNIRYGILSIIVLFIAGGGLLVKVNMGEGEHIAKKTN